MKKHVLLLTMLFAGLALTSCGENTSSSSASSSSLASSSSSSIGSSSESDSSKQDSSSINDGEDSSSSESSDSSESSISEIKHYAIDTNVKMGYGLYLSSANFSYKVDGVEVTDLSSVAEGSAITVTVTSSSDATVYAGTGFYLSVNGEFVYAESTSESSGNSVTFEFSMPSSDVSLKLLRAIAKEDSEGITIKLDKEYEGIEFTCGFISGRKYEITSDYQFYFNLTPGYVLSAASYTLGSDTTSKSISISSNSTWFDIYVGNSNTEDITISLTLENKGFASVTWVGLTSEYVSQIDSKDFASYELPSAYTCGAKATIYITPVSTKILSKVTGTLADNTELDVNTYKGTWVDYYEVSFTVPTQAFTLAFEFSDMGKITYSGDSSNLDGAPIISSSSYNVSDSYLITTALPGSYVYVYVKPISGQIPTKLKYTNNGTTSESTFSSADSYITGLSNSSEYYKAYFTMPDSGDVTFDVESQTSYTITYEDSNVTGAKIYRSSYSSQIFVEGEKVSLYIEVPSKFYELDYVEASYGDVTAEKWTYDNGKLTKNYSGFEFVMPAGNLTLKPYFKKLEGKTIAVTADTDISSFEVRGYNSDTSVTAAGDLEVLPTDEFYITAKTSSSATTYPQIVVTYDDNTTATIEPKSSSIYSSTATYNYDYIPVSVSTTEGETTTTKYATAINLKATTKATIAGTITGIPAGSTLKYTMKVNGTEVTDFSSVKQFDEVYFELDSTSYEEGYRYSFEVVATANSETKFEVSSYYHTFKPTEAFTIVITRSEVGEFSYTMADTFYSYSSWGLYIGDTSNYSNFYSKDDLVTDGMPKGQVATLRVSYLYDTSYDYVAANIAITNNGETTNYITKYDSTSYNYVYFDAEGKSINAISFTVNGDVSIAFTAYTEA